MPELQLRQRRRKVTLACEPCRERKARCDGVKPLCSTCRRRSLGIEQCIYKVGNARTACSDDYTKALHRRIRQLEQVCASHGIDPDALPVEQDNRPEHTQSRVELDAIVMETLQGQVPTPMSSAATEGIESCGNARRVTAMGTTTSEEAIEQCRGTSQGFYGLSSAASFLKDAYGTVKPSWSGQTSGNPQTTPTSRSSLLFNSIEKFVLPPRALADHLIERYFQRVYYLYPIFDREAFEHAYESLWQQSGRATNLDKYRDLGIGEDASTIAFHSSLNSIFALGCIFSNLSPMAKATAYEVFFNRSKQNTGLDLLDLNNLSVVQTLILVSIVLQGTSFPDRCWNAVGLACRVAQGLGLHSMPKYDPHESRVWQIRRRTWHGCVVLDTLVSMTFGRPTMITNLSSLSVPTSMDFNTQSAEGNQQIKLQFQLESVRLNVILDSILAKVYRPWQCRLSFDEQSLNSRADTAWQSMDAFVELHRRLQAFEASVPRFLSWKQTLITESMSSEDVKILAIQRNVLHARFIYLGLMLYRPILTQLLAADVSDNVGDDLHLSFSHDGARACVQSAIRLIDLVHDIFRTDASEAWWWNGLCNTVSSNSYACTTSLVLMTCRLCPSLWVTLDQAGVATSWEKCQVVLEASSSFSPSIRKSFDLLLKINQTITARQEGQ
ncbi:fungal-specific transcription factor domain-containing protein [Mariannaea sp. PMI_226]|nr:fungal-specific transcription factor domain-containing protein [Mariannaea sp. PMI_226]